MAFSSTASTLTVQRRSSTPQGFKLNFDGSALGNLGVVGVGGIIRNSLGSPVLSFLGPVGVCSANEVEL